MIIVSHFYEKMMFFSMYPFKGIKEKVAIGSSNLYSLKKKYLFLNDHFKNRRTFIVVHLNKINSRSVPFNINLIIKG